MNCFERLDRMVETSNGYLCTSKVLENGISKPTLAGYVRARSMERVAQGVYLATDAWPDALYLLSLSNSRIVFSHETALFLHGLMEREPVRITVTVRKGYNASHLRKQGVHVSYVKPEWAEMGLTTAQTGFGNSVRVYDMERTFCDVLRSKDSMDIQVFRYAVREYMASRRKNLSQLMQYARAFQMESLVRTYTEVLL